MLTNLAVEERIDPRIKRTRQLLKQAFMELLSEKGFQALTIQDITDRATVNRVTFYAHFEDKYALLEYAMREMFTEHLYGKLPRDSSFSTVNLAQLITTVCEFLARVTRHCSPQQVEFEPLMEKQIKAELAAVLKCWLEKETDGLPEGSKFPASPELAAMIASWAIYGAAEHWNKIKSSQSADEFSQQVLPIILCIFEPSPILTGPQSS
jgi:AcrR family transcriptional regulator